MELTLERDAELGARLPVAKMPAHWLMARLGKRVLRPGGVETTRWLLDQTRIDADDDVVELAPGLGHTARAIVARAPRSYVGVERDAAAVLCAERTIARHPSARIVHASASSLPLEDECASVVFGEAMLSMQPAAAKKKILAEAHRVLRAGGRYAIHELAVMPDDLDARVLAQIERDLSASIHVGVRIGTVAQWKRWLDEAGFDATEVTTAPMRLLEAGRVLQDEGLWRAIRFTVNALRVPGAARRLLEVRASFRAHEKHLCAVAIVARRRAGAKLAT